MATTSKASLDDAIVGVDPLQFIPPTQTSISDGLNIPPELKNEAEKIWKELDHLALSDPKKYKEYIQNQIKEFQTTKPVIDKGLAVKCKSDGRENHYINICQSDRMEKPEASALLKMTGSIPITLDEPRKRRDKQSQPYTVHDIIVHPSVVQRARKSADFEQSLVQLAMYSIQSTFPGVLLKKGYKLCKVAYKGDFQWTVEGSKRKDMSEMDGQEEDTTLKEIKQSLNNVHDDNPEAPITIPSSTNTHNTASIVEVSSTKQSPVHQFTAEEDNNIRVLTVHLPLEESSAEFELTAGEQDLQLETPNYALQLRLPCKDSSIDAKFDVYSKLLTVKLLN